MKKLILLASLVLSINAFGQIPTNGLVGYWPFNGNANDESGNNHHGTVSGSTLVEDRFGKPNSAYSFDGINDKIFIGNDLLVQGKISISCWIKSNAIGGQIISTGNRNSYRIGKTSDGVDGDVYLSDNSDGHGSGGISAKTDMNSWNNITMVYNGSQLLLYINGVLQNTVSAVGDIFNNQPTYLHFGVYQYLGSNYDAWYKGLLDDVRFYNRALSASEIASLADEGICKTSITVTDTLIINANITGFNPVEYANTIKVYPNPTKDAITIDCGNNFNTLNGYTIKITNSLSQMVYISKVNQQSTSIKLNSWTGKGIYFVHLIDASNNTIDIRKIVLQ